MKKSYLLLSAAVVLFISPALAQTSAQEMDNRLAPTPSAAARAADVANPPPVAPVASPLAPSAPSVATPAAPAAAAASPSTTSAAASSGCPTPTPAQKLILSNPNLPESLVKLYTDRLNAFNAMDKNCDGFITPAEWQAAHDAAFAAADLNHDGMLSKDEAAGIVSAFKAEVEKNPTEIASTRANTLQNRMDNIDGNNDGIITKAEWDAYYNARFQKLDKNADGNLDLMEFQTDDEEARRRRE